VLAWVNGSALGNRPEETVSAEVGGERGGRGPAVARGDGDSLHFGARHGCQQRDAPISGSGAYVDRPRRCAAITPAAPRTINARGAGHHQCSQKARRPWLPSNPAPKTPSSTNPAPNTRPARFGLEAYPPPEFPPARSRFRAARPRDAAGAHEGLAVHEANGREVTLAGQRALPLRYIGGHVRLEPPDADLIAVKEPPKLRGRGVLPVAEDDCPERGRCGCAGLQASGAPEPVVRQGAHPLRYLGDVDGERPVVHGAPSTCSSPSRAHVRTCAYMRAVSAVCCGPPPRAGRGRWGPADGGTASALRQASLPRARD
jgi:hypothetical protein